MKIPRRKLGRQGLEVSAIGLGCGGMSAFYGPTDEPNNLRVLHAALDMGIDFLDTADVYGLGANEPLLAQVLRTRRGEVVLASQIGQVCGPAGEFRGISGRPDYVRSACDVSLRRLGVDHIDLYYQHGIDPTVPIEETIGAMAELVSAGKVRHLGLSNASANSISANAIRRAVKVHPIAALQSEFSLWTREPEASVLPACEELGIGVVAGSPLGGGFAGRLPLVEIVTQIARDEGYTPAQVALAWLLDCAPYIVPIPGSHSIRQLKENALAVMVRLGESQLERLYGSLRERSVSGECVPAARMASVDA